VVLDWIAIGAGLGIGRIGGSAMDAIARQPEVRKNPKRRLMQLH
jgi:F0F1-type ATP synthase membrane subunit c/vacuolar-type H+-ATPase subunit K